MTALLDSFKTHDARPGAGPGAGPSAGPSAGDVGTGLRAWRSALRRRSIRLRLSATFSLFLLLVVTLGLFSILELRNVNRVSADIRDRWLQSVRVLGDLNNFTSDYRAAEASHLLASDAVQVGATDREIVQLDRDVARAQADYRAIPHDTAELTLYRRFTGEWEAYHAAAGRVMQLSHADSDAEGARVYMKDSRRAFEQASDTLGLLTSLTVANARKASDQAVATYRAARTTIFLAIAAAGLILVGAVNYITRAISNPLLELAACMRSLAANETNVDIDGAERRDEIGEMARAVEVFRNNAIELAHSQRGLVQQALMLEERLGHERQLTALQRNFVSMASHEFRTPLNIIDGHAQRLINLKNRAGPADVAERAGRIRSAVQRMTQVMDGLLNSARLFEGEASLYFHPTEFDLAELIGEVVRLHRESTPNARIEASVRLAQPSFVGDHGLLFQMFSNLLSNAVKYSPDGGLIRLEAETDADRVLVRVTDQGLGIPEKDLDRVFELYHRGSNVTRIAGTGVGLYLVKTVVELHGGEVAVDSREGEGARFTMQLPARG